MRRRPLITFDEFRCTFLLFVLLALLAHVADADDRQRVVRADQGVKGCTAVLSLDRQSTYYEKVIVVGEKEHAPDQEDEYWGYFPERKQKRDVAGNAIAMNFPKSQFLRVGAFRMLGGRKAECPPFFWGVGNSSASAEQR